MLVQETLEYIGFEPKEVQIYLYLLRHGPSLQQTIANETGLLRQTVYEMIKKMASKGYISLSSTGKRKVCSAVPARLLVDKVREKEERLLRIVPQLEQLEAEEKVSVRSESFIGIEGVKNAINLTLESSEELLWLDNITMSAKILGGDYYWLNYAEKRAERGLPIKLLISPKDKSYLDSDKGMLRETRRNELLEGIKGSIVIFEDRVIIYSVEEGQLLGVLIQNKAIKNSFEKIFRHLWGKSKG